MMRNTEQAAVYREIFDIIRQARGDIFVAAHVKTDGDAVGACGALALAAEGLGKRVRVLMEALPDDLAALISDEYLYIGDGAGLDVPDVFIALDTSEKGRLGCFERLFDGARVTVNIDHHKTNIGFGQINVINGDISSVCELLYDILASNDVVITREIAAMLYVGILTDTGGFRYSATSSDTLRVVATLMDTGIDFTTLYNRHLMERTPSAARLAAVATSRTEYSADRKIAWSYISAEDFERCGSGIFDTGGIVESLLNVRGVEVSAFFYNVEGGIAARLRSKEFDVAKFLSRYGGGGHKLAAGATIKGDLNDAIGLVMGELSAAI